MPKETRVRSEEDYIMGFSILKCPACGGNLNVETDKDFIFCQFCGAKLMKADNKIVIEHIERKIDEAEIERQKLEREESAIKRESDRKSKRLAFILAVIGIVLVALGFRDVEKNGYLGIVGFLIIGIAGMAVPVDNANKRNTKK